MSRSRAWPIRPVRSGRRGARSTAWRCRSACSARCRRTWRSTSRSWRRCGPEPHFEFRAGPPAGAANPVDFVLQGHLAEGRVDDPRLPLPLTDLEADVFCDNRQLRIENVTAQSGPTTLELSCRCDGFLSGIAGACPHGQSRASCHSTIASTSRCRRVCRRSGTSSRRAAPSTWWPRCRWPTTVSQPDIDINCRDVSFSYHKFPLRLQQGHGAIHYRGQHDPGPRVHWPWPTARRSSLAAEFQDPGPAGDRLADRAFRRTDSAERRVHLRRCHPTGQRIMRSLHPERRDHGRPGPRRETCAGRAAAIAVGSAAQRLLRCSTTDSRMRFRTSRANS